MDAEWQALRKYGTFDIVDLSDIGKQKLFSLTWVYKIKRGADGAISKCKSRLCARGFLQVPGLHFNEHETYAGVLSYSSLRLLCALACSRGYTISLRDISNAYLNSTLDQPLYTEIPEPYSMKGKALALRRGIYGLRQSAWLWAKTLSQHLLRNGFKRSVAEPSIFYRFWYDDEETSETASKDRDLSRQDGDSTTAPTGAGVEGVKDKKHGRGKRHELYIGCYVDDLTCVSSDSTALDFFDKVVGDRFPFNPTEMRDLDASKGKEGLGWVLSTEVRHHRESGILEMNQTAAIERIASRFGITDLPPVSLPLDPNKPLLPATEDDELIDYKTYLSLVGSLLHISQVTRPDIAHAVGVLTRFSAKPTKLHWDAAIGTARFLYHTKNKQLRYVRSGDGDQRDIPYVLSFHPGEDSFRVFADADYAGSHDSRSTTGYVVYMAGAPISWASRTQRLVAQSTTESEIISLAEAIKETINLKLLLEELELRPPDSPVPIHEDNSAATIMSTNEGCHPKAKHYRVRLAFIRENTLSRDGAPPVVTIHQTPTLSQLADGFTKSLTKDLFRTFQNAVLSPPIPPIKESNQEPSTSAVREN